MTLINEIQRHRLRCAVGEVNINTNDLADLVGLNIEICEKILNTQVAFNINMFIPFFVAYKINVDYIYGISLEMFDHDLINMPKYIKKQDLQVLFLTKLKQAIQ